MAIIEVLLLDAPRDVGVYAIACSVTGESTMQLRKRVADGEPLVVWDTNDFPSDSERTEHHDQIRVLAACVYLQLAIRWWSIERKFRMGGTVKQRDAHDDWLASVFEA